MTRLAMNALVLTVSGLALMACANKDMANKFADEPFVEAKVVEGPPPPSIIVEKVKPLPLPGQLKKLGGRAKKTDESDDPLMRVDEANELAKLEPRKAAIVETGVAEHLSRHTTLRIHPALFGEGK